MRDSQNNVVDEYPMLSSGDTREVTVRSGQTYSVTAYFNTIVLDSETVTITQLAGSFALTGLGSTTASFEAGINYLDPSASPILRISSSGQTVQDFDFTSDTVEGELSGLTAGQQYEVSIIVVNAGVPESYCYVTPSSFTTLTGSLSSAPAGSAVDWTVSGTDGVAIEVYSTTQVMGNEGPEYQADSLVVSVPVDSASGTFSLSDHSDVLVNGETYIIRLTANGEVLKDSTGTSAEITLTFQS